MMSANSRFGYVTLMCYILLAGCRPPAAVDVLRGEWVVLVPDGSTAQDTLGRMVFGPRIPCYCDDVFSMPKDGISGRAYLGTAEGNPPAYGSDLQEAVIARYSPQDDSVIIEGIAGYRFAGRADGDSLITGEWIDAEAATMRRTGTFEMRAVAPTAITDSARIRGSREVARWLRGDVPPPVGPVDTVLPINALPPQGR